MPGRLSQKRPASRDLDDEASQIDASQQSSRIRVDPGTLSDVDDDDDAAQATSTIDDLAKKLVRLALAQESQRRPLRRQDIGDKVLGNAGRQFKKVFAQAQHELRTVFGMELVELPAREKLTVAQRRAAQQKTATSKAPTTAWMLTSILLPEYRTTAILPPSAAPQSSSESTYTGLYSVVVALISLNGGLLVENRLDRFLSRLRLEESTPLKRFDKTEQLLKRMEKDGYLVKIRDRIGVSGEEEISWVLGSRAKVEIGNAGVRGLVETVYGTQSNEASAELTKKLERSLGANDSHTAETPAVANTQQDSQQSRRARRATRHGDEADEMDDE